MTRGVDLLLGHTVTALVNDGRRVTGVVARRDDRREVTIQARLVVGADGHRSRVAELAGVEARHAPNARFLFWGYYQGVRLRSPGRAAMWLVDPHVAVAVPTDDDLTLLGAFPTKALVEEFADDRLGALERFFAALPDGPDLTHASRASKAIGTTDYPTVRRPPHPRPGLALIGDAATASDPVPAVGCGWAFRSAEWLADAPIAALHGRTGLRAGLAAYERRHRFIARHDRLIRADARGRGPNPVQRAIRQAAPHDPDIASRLGRFSMRAAPTSVLLNPRTVARATLVARRARRRGR
jgi:2-polyprenyl-6-methoxyphenol hydroxylase-like FAD-dependent oxidoreductase